MINVFTAFLLVVVLEDMMMSHGICAGGDDEVMWDLLRRR